MRWLESGALTLLCLLQQQGDERVELGRGEVDGIRGHFPERGRELGGELDGIETKHRGSARSLNAGARGAAGGIHPEPERPAFGLRWHEAADLRLHAYVEDFARGAIQGGSALVLDFEKSRQQRQLAAGERQFHGRKLHGALFLSGRQLRKQRADHRCGGDPGALAVAAGGELDAGGGKAQAHAAGRLEREVKRLGGIGGLAGLWGNSLGVQGFEAALDSEGAGLARWRGSKHVKEGHQHGFGLLSGFQCAGGRGAEQKREKDESERYEAVAEKAR